ncbi:hypothetical protein [Methylococcus sp. EFPC2]|uniref:hypothetical protein n=1 Tax=Methylococcus sp. EFPC2 TaxID=2812648 RepID=UPI001967E5BF|nr:hypothetical protein [Methylococcus sp. EFPC2]QSA98823.1 hypothetical protein JWZ97_08615 [Methylococcus sp. EFPC2]
MPQLSQETARWRAELQAAEAAVSARSGPLQAAQQTAASALSQLNAAQARLAEAQARIAPLEAEAASADAHVADLEQEILDASEPDQEFPGRPGGAGQRQRIAALKRQLAQAKAAAAAAHATLDSGRAALAQAGAEAQAAQVRMLSANAELQAAQTAFEEARQRLQQMQAELARIDRWNGAIAADPLDRPALERSADELAAQAAALEESCEWARVQFEIEQETLAALTARGDELAGRIDRIGLTELPAAQARLRELELSLGTLEEEIRTTLQEGPTP